MKIFAVGMNYIQHNKELDGTLYKPEEPVIFTKADSALIKGHKPFFVPDFMGRIDYEAELVVRICRLGKSIPARFAHRYYDAVTIGVDFTARDMQREARAKGNPWTISKGFDGSAVIGDWIDKDEVGDVQSLDFHLDINGNTVQRGCGKDMLFDIDGIIEYISRYFTIKTGDLLFTGTPPGVGPVSVNDHIEGWIGEKKVLEFNCR